MLKARLIGRHVNFFTVDDKGKDIKVPWECSPVAQLYQPNECAVAYWAHYGINRKEFTFVDN